MGLSWFPFVLDMNDESASVMNENERMRLLDDVDDDEEFLQMMIGSTPQIPDRGRTEEFKKVTMKFWNKRYTAPLDLIVHSLYNFCHGIFTGQYWRTSQGCSNAKY